MATVYGTGCLVAAGPGGPGGSYRILIHLSTSYNDLESHVLG